MLSQLATRFTVSMAFLAAALVFSPYPLLDQSEGPSPPHSIINNVEHLAQPSKQFAADVSKESGKMEGSELETRAQQVGDFRDSLIDAVDNQVSAGGNRIQEVKAGLENAAEKMTEGSHNIADAAKQHVKGGAKKVVETGEASLDASKESASASVKDLEQAASSGLQSTKSAAGQALEKTFDAGAQALDAGEPALDAASKAPQQLKKGTEKVGQSLLESVGRAVETVKEQVKPGVEKARVAAQGLREKLEAVTAHIRESTTWPEPEAISILAEGVWAPKQHNPLPDLSGLLDASQAHVDSEHTENSVEEKLGIRMDHGSSPKGALLFVSKLWTGVKRLFDQAVRKFQVSLGLIHTDSSQPSKVSRGLGTVLRVVHLAAVVVHLGVALWLLRTGCSWLLGQKQSALSGDRRRTSAWVEAVCSTIALTTFLSLYPWTKSGAREQSEVQVLIGTAVDSLVRLIWDRRSLRKELGASSNSPASQSEAPDGSSSPSSKKRNKKQKKSGNHMVEKDQPGFKNSLLGRYKLSGFFSLLTKLSVIIALCFHLSFLSSESQVTS
ncbi:hypothetical protein KFL_002510070 [Klebsormidium nitens]|uniref:Transmembrane protein n=1 Tax=Klebsormidium nitens TaxID=105231 RepID=A0A1Y1I475_KLENI|nr:hypothetical protein KFL_002510070 [Klebsormidium nitens]|eukprot:GAQ85730.1 hypothetical protein KFL_002510070 [Klebsormidium nitens]